MGLKGVKWVWKGVKGIGGGGQGSFLYFDFIFCNLIALDLLIVKCPGWPSKNQNSRFYGYFSRGGQMRKMGKIGQFFNENTVKMTIFNENYHIFKYQLKCMWNAYISILSSRVIMGKDSTL